MSVYETTKHVHTPGPPITRFVFLIYCLLEGSDRPGFFVIQNRVMQGLSVGELLSSLGLLTSNKSKNVFESVIKSVKK